MLDSVVQADSVDGLLQANFSLAWISTIYIFPHGLPSFGIHNNAANWFCRLGYSFYNKRNELEGLCKASLLAANGFVTDK